MSTEPIVIKVTMDDEVVQRIVEEVKVLVLAETEEIWDQINELTAQHNALSVDVEQQAEEESRVVWGSDGPVTLRGEDLKAHKAALAAYWEQGGKP